LDKLTNQAEWLIFELIEEDVADNHTLFSLNNSFLEGLDSGTIVLWQQIDRLDDKATKEIQQSSFDELLNKSREHLELVFHRIICPEPGYRKTAIKMNNSELKAFDPFFTSSLTTQPLTEEVLTYDGESIKVSPYVLPHHDKVSKDDYNKYAGTEGYLHNQGFYVYRNRRLLTKGTWFRLRKKEELTKLVRVRIDVPNSLDYAWKVDVKKSRIIPPESIRNELKRIIGKIGESGKRTYTQRGTKLRDKVSMPVWKRIAKNSQIFYEINREHAFLKSFEESLNPAQFDKFKAVLSMIDASFPVDMFYSDCANSSESVERAQITDERLSKLLNDYIDFWELKELSSGEDDRVRELLKIEPFYSHQKRTKRMLIESGLYNE
jgi:hypothetical protein